mmetsp:Transcript_130091/g.225209  ORF Transcript_130091/g.225209 Transcript_130091/m.225209 type:complete len:83 (-) Transcript_130091:356-604(-)
MKPLRRKKEDGGLRERPRAVRQSSLSAAGNSSMSSMLRASSGSADEFTEIGGEYKSIFDLRSSGPPPYLSCKKAQTAAFRPR